jgi:hypothetical protein
VADEPAVAGDVYFATIGEELQKERDRKASLEQRALAVITSSGVLVSLLFGFQAVVRKPAGPDQPAGVRVLLAASLVCFVAAVLLGLTANRPVDHRPLGVKTDLRRMVGDDFWSAGADSARRGIAAYRVEEIDLWRDNNKTKASILQRAIQAESLAIALLAASVATGLFT